MKNNEKIDQIISFIKNQEGWNYGLLINDIIDGNKDLLRFETNNNKTIRLSQDELTINWAEDYVGSLDDFINDYTKGLLKSVVFMLESFKDNEDGNF